VNILCVVLKIDFQIERFIRSLNSNIDNVHILTLETLKEQVEENFLHQYNLKSIITYKNHGNLFNIAMDDHALMEQIKLLNIDNATILYTTKSKSIKFIPQAHMTDISLFYMLCSFLKKCHISQTSIYDMGTVTQVVVPLILEEFINKHSGKRAFIIGNGPSLNNIDMTKLKHEVTFGSNRVHLGFKKWGFEVNYWGIIDRLQIEEHLAEWEQCIPQKSVKFFPFEYLPILHFHENYCPINLLYGYPDQENNPRFGDDPNTLYLGFTVTHTLLQIAVIMGCNPIYLVGVDHNYNTVDHKEKKAEVKPLWKKLASKWISSKKNHQPNSSLDEYISKNIWTAKDATEATHFDASYNDPTQGRRFVIPRPEKSEKAFMNARIWAEAHGIQIFNATPNTKLEVFEKVKFESLFGEA